MQHNFRFSFRPVTKMQQPLILEWIAQKHINEWLHGDGLENTINDLPLKNIVFQRFYKPDGKSLSLLIALQQSTGPG